MNRRTFLGLLPAAGALVGMKAKAAAPESGVAIARAAEVAATPGYQFQVQQGAYTPEYYLPQYYEIKPIQIWPPLNVADYGGLIFRDEMTREEFRKRYPPSERTRD